MEKKSLYKRAESSSKNSFFPKNHKGLSGIITAVILVALVLAAAMIVWGVVNKMIKGQMESAESCFGNYNKVTLNSLYTCYDSTENTFQFSLSIGDIEVDSVIVSVSSEGSTNSYTLVNDTTEVSGLGPYPSGSGDVALPAKNAGLTYIASGILAKPDLVKIAPVINGQQCEVSDTISNIGACF